MKKNNKQIHLTNTIAMIVIPKEEYDILTENSHKILAALEQLKLVAPPEFINRKEFMAKARIASTKFHELMKSGNLKYKKVGRMVYVPIGELNRFFNGEISSKPNQQ